MIGKTIMCHPDFEHIAEAKALAAEHNVSLDINPACPRDHMYVIDPPGEIRRFMVTGQ